MAGADRIVAAPAVPHPLLGPLPTKDFGENLAADVAAIRQVCRDGCPKCSLRRPIRRTWGLYRERVGALIVVSDDESRADAAYSHMLADCTQHLFDAARPWSGPSRPASSRTRTCVNPWISELGRNADSHSRHAAVVCREKLRAVTGDDSFRLSFKLSAECFSLLGVSTAVVDRLRRAAPHLHDRRQAA